MVPSGVRTLRAVRAGAGRVLGIAAGVAALAIATLLVGLVAGRAMQLNIVWIPEATRIVFIWGVALGCLAVSCGREHFKVEIFGKEDVDAPGVFAVLRTVLAVLLFGYVAVGGWPTIASASMQAFASLPFSYSLMRTAVVSCLAGMCVVEVLVLLEQVQLLAARRGASARRATS